MDRLIKAYVFGLTDKESNELHEDLISGKQTTDEYKKFRDKEYQKVDPMEVKENISIAQIIGMSVEN